MVIKKSATIILLNQLLGSKIMKKRLLLANAFLTISTSAFIDWSSTITLANDYLFNGVSQTDEIPAIPGSIDWSGNSGWYAGGWV
jgi:uncharacterized protein (TIGR02001 family)